MNLHLLSTNVNDRPRALSRAVITAATEEEARGTHPDGSSTVLEQENDFGMWVSLRRVQVECLGEARPGMQAGVILASYIA
jgi:hypothetical protein